MIDTENLTQDLRPEKKVINPDSWFDKHYRKIETNYDDLYGVIECVGVDDRYWTMIIDGTRKHSNQAVNVLMAATFIVILMTLQVVEYYKYGVIDPMLTSVYYIGAQIGLFIYAVINHYKSQVNQGRAVVFDRKTGNVHFPAVLGNKELIVPFAQVNMYMGVAGYSRGSGEKFFQLKPKVYPKDQRSDFAYAVLFADYYDQACGLWTLLTEFMDKNKPIPTGVHASLQFYIEEKKSPLWKGNLMNDRYPISDELKQYDFIYPSDPANAENRKKYEDLIRPEYIAPHSDNPALLAQNVERAYQMNIIW